MRRAAGVMVSWDTFLCTNSPGARRGSSWDIPRQERDETEFLHTDKRVPIEARLAQEGKGASHENFSLLKHVLHGYTATHTHTHTQGNCNIASEIGPNIFFFRQSLA